MTVRKVASGWQADFRPEGRGGKRIRKTFPSKKEAEQFEVREKAKAQSGDYQAPVRDNRRLSALADEWFKLVGHELSTGAKRLQILQATIKALGDPIAKNADAKAFLEYRKKRLSDGFTANHLNHELTYLKTVFNKLIKLDEWRHKNPYEKIEPLKLQKKELHYLSLDEITRLLSALDAARNPDVKTIVKICLATGCRFGEAQGLSRKHLRGGKIEFIDTKNGDNRAVPISEDLRREIISGRPPHGKLFRNSWDAFEFALNRAGITLPKGQKTHVLRHTFASQFMMAGGNILDLNKILGHKTLQMTMVYAHLSPEHLEVVLLKNPLKILEEKTGGHNVDTLP